MAEQEEKPQSTQDTKLQELPYQEDYDRFVKTITHDDPVMMILRAHLFMEYYMDQLIIAGLERGDIVLERKPGFIQKLILVQALNCLPSRIIDSLRGLNTVRNNCSHVMDYQILEQDVDKIGSPLGKEYLKDKAEYKNDTKALLVDTLIGLAAPLVGNTRRYIEKSLED